MKTVLSDLYHGKISPFGQILPKHKEYYPTNAQVADGIEHFRKMLSEEEFKKLEKVFDLWTECTLMETEQTFIDAFKLGALLMAECL